MAIGNGGEGFSFPHGHRGRGSAFARGPPAAADALGQLELSSRFQMVGVLDFVDLDQPLHTHAQAIGDFREGFPRLHPHGSCHGGQRKDQGEGQDGRGTAHGTGSFIELGAR